MIGQSQVTDPLMTALRTNRVNHAYLFSGPRGCGKTTSARILARCLNCAEGPTDTPCGVCPSCVELSRDGNGSLDVVEIDAASHGGVDDARDLRERAIFAPARDRYKIFIIDEAHMVTPGGFNALLKIVEEPPEHIKFIFATTEPDKVIGTIRSRTHHYPFRLIPPAQMLDYIGTLCESEHVSVAAGVLPLVVRAGGGSARDTLSLLDQLMAGSENETVDYERAVALLGYTHGALLNDVIDALAERDSAEAFGAVDRVVQTGQDPRRFVEDLLERLRDLIVVAATGGGAGAVLRGLSQDELDHMAVQSRTLGMAELSRVADIVNAALTEMTGATSPRLHLELMIARALVHGSATREPAAAAAVAPAPRAVEQLAPRVVQQPAPPVAAPVREAARPEPSAPVAPPAASVPPAPSAPPAPLASGDTGPITLQRMKDAWPEILEVVQKTKMTAWLIAYTAQVRALKDDVLTLSFPSQNDVDSFKMTGQAGQPGVSEYLRQAIQQVLGLRVKYIARVDAARPDEAAAAAPLVTPAPVVEPVQSVTPPPSADGWATVAIPGGGATPTEPERPAAPEPARLATVLAEAPARVEAPAEPVRHSDEPVLAEGAPLDEEPPFDDEPPYDEEPPEDTMPPFEAPPPATDWAPAPPDAGPSTPAAAPRRTEPPAPPAASVPRPTTRTTRSETADGRQRYGEAVVREILGAQFIEEQPHEPRGPRIQ